jgi:uncharacterized membrane-anchored protein
MIAGKRLIVSAVALALAQIAFLSWVIAGRAAILRDGREILLKVEPVDPRDLLRGDYVRLGYEIASIPTNLISNIPADASYTVAGPVHVRLKKQDDGYWRAVSATLYQQPANPPAAEEVDIRGHVGEGWNLGEGTSISVDYGIERYYVPEGEGKAIEQDLRVRPFGLKVAVAGDGTAQIKALMDGETMLYEEPLY